MTNFKEIKRVKNTRDALKMLEGMNEGDILEWDEREESKEAGG